MRRRLPVLVLSALSVSGCGSVADSRDRPAPETLIESTVLTVYVSDEDGIAFDCAAVRALAWDAAATSLEQLPTEAVRRVIRDVTPSATLHPEGTQPLSDYFSGVRLEERTAIVGFGGAALAYLNSTACVQAAAKTPIIRTLLEFQGIDEVVWEIDGEIFDAWDA